MTLDLRIWLGVAAILYVAAFIVLSRLAHVIRNRGHVRSAICFMPLILATVIESVSCGWLALSGNIAPVPTAERFGTLASPFMAMGTLVIGVWGLIELQCPNMVCTRSKTKHFFRELMKAVPD